MITAPTTSSTAETAGYLRLAVGRLARRMRQESVGRRSPTSFGILNMLDGRPTTADLAAAERPPAHDHQGGGR